ncbi:rhamnosyl/mannosyltransferase [Inhella inkyongensis]|uniref:Rhamnosyl/mannosyltransferase n=1 Tax=Inhella inkyongensis TaxID=392593 RepID=A0A840S4T0_9BURK|nr:glycosyltransferase [Inhella inkyongensis]MBB5204478.1 rhamnosyl/mannosyltransferase [Inhella inkyongensis]
MSSPLRPLHVGKFLPPPFAGMETHVDTLLRAIANESAPTLVASEPTGRQSHPLEGLPYRVISVPYYGMVASVPLCPGMLKAVRTEYRQGRANLMHVHAPNPWGDMAILRAPKDLPVVMTWHSDIVRQRTLLRFYGSVQQAALRRADRILVFTPNHYESSAQLHVERLDQKIEFVPIGIDFDALDNTLSDTRVQAELQQWVQGRPLILTVGRHVYYKGYNHLLAAMARLRSDAVLLMVGTGPLLADLQRQCQELGLGARVRFMGEVDRAALVTALRQCDLFCLPSIERAEAFGIASAEAMACGKPTVVCDLRNGVNFLNRAGETSLIAPPRDEAALADALDTLARDAGLRERMGAAARAWVRARFDIAAMREGTLALYRKLV